jgi:glycosyltransferase involved in cell wall biosynthesis
MQTEMISFENRQKDRRSGLSVKSIASCPMPLPVIETAPPSVSVVVPAMNEAKNLPSVLPLIPSWVHEVILVDGGSTDDTVAVAKATLPGIRIVHQTLKGKGNALSIGFRAATGDIIVMIDADGSTDPAEIPRFISALRTGSDFVKGTRYIPGGGSEDITFIRTAGNRIFTLIVNTLWRTNYTDLCYGYIAFWTRHLEVLAPDCRGFEVETLLCVRAVERGLRVAEVGSFESNRISGTSNLNAVRDGMRVLRTIVAERVRPW